MYNCTKLHTGSAVARVTKDRAARSHLPSTVENQLGRRRQRRQLLTIGQWNVRTLLDRERANRPERRMALVPMELAKYNIDIAALCETYKDACRLLQKHTRALKSDCWERKAVELQRAADSNNMKGLYNGLKEVWGPK